MRIAALFCGVIAGLFAVLAPLAIDVDLLSMFLQQWGAASSQQLLGLVVWHAPAAVSVLGAVLAFVAPGIGALLLLAAGLGWIGFGLADAEFLRFELLMPAAIALAGSLLAFLAGELEVRRLREARRSRRENLREGNDRLLSEERDREAAFNLDPLTVPREEAPPRPVREIPLTLEDVVPPEPEPQRRRSETIWPDSPGRSSMFERPEPQIDITPRRALFEKPAARTERPAPASESRERERNYHDREPSPQRNRMVWIIAANGVALLLLAIGVTYMLMQREAPPAAAVVANATEATAATSDAAVPALAEDERLTPNLWPALPGSEEAQSPELPMPANVAPDAAQSAALAAGAYADPYAYCGAVKTVDYLDSRYTGPRITADIAEALRVPLQSAPDRVSWRCVDGVVYACASFDWPVCAMTPSAQEMLDYCARNPGVARLLAPNGTWSCEGSRPKLPEGASWPVDARGFFPQAWIPVLPAQRPTG